uniref:Aquaporin n=1 Tax=Ascaris lumbricoides TaxID=6252 RepID=A0A0M3ISF1_ASCLU
MWSTLDMTIAIACIQLTFALQINRVEVKRFVYQFNGSEISGHPITQPSLCPLELLLNNRDDSKTLVISTRRKHYHDISGGQCFRILESLKKDGSFGKSYGHQVRFCSTVCARLSAPTPQDKTAVLELSSFYGPIHLCSLEYIFALLFICAIVGNTYASFENFAVGGKRERQTVGPIHLCSLEYIFALLFICAIVGNTYASFENFSVGGKRERQTVGIIVSFASSVTSNVAMNYW